MRGAGATEERGFLFDVGRCTGCSACELACSTENALGWGRSWRQVVSMNAERRPGAPAYHLSLACNHCTEAPCLAQCPTRAIRRDAGTGAVLIDDAVCVGCGYCAWVCPYDAPRFDAERGVMGKCTACHHRLQRGEDPACVVACPTGALGFGALEGEVGVPGFPDTPAGPAIRFCGLPGQAAPLPVSSWEPPADLVASFAAARPDVPRTLTLRAELPLWLFTTAVAALVGWVTAAAFAGVALGRAGFVATAAGAAVVSALHLGRPERAWRALLHVRRSRLSREVAAYGAFVAAGAVLAWTSSGSPAGSPAPGVPAAVQAWLGWLAAGLGLLTLVAVDRVYDPVRAPGGRPVHSADAVPTGALVAALLAGWLPGVVGLGALKAVLYVQRTVRGGSAGGPAVATLRLLALAGAVAAVAAGGGAGVAAIAALLVGELVDRGQFYEELQPTSPGAPPHAEGG